MRGRKLTKKQMETIQGNLFAFTKNFGEVRIERAEYGNGFYVFYPADSETWLQYCHDISYLDGWLYGIVQGVIRGEFAKFRTN